MLSQQSETFDPESVLKQVWQGEYPADWRVYFGTVSSGLLVLLVTLQVLLGVVGALFLLLGIGVLIEAIAAKAFAAAIVTLTLVAVILLIPIGLILLLRRAARKARERANQQSRPTIVVMPQGVVAYHRKQTSALVYAHITQMQLRVQAMRKTITTYSTTVNASGSVTTLPMTTSVPAAPSIWLDLVLQNGQRGVWHIDLAPQDAIAQSIIEAYTLYRSQSGPRRDEMA
jgi:hypothetical protein